MHFLSITQLFLMIPVGITIHGCLAKTLFLKNLWFLIFSLTTLVWASPQVAITAVMTLILTYVLGLMFLFKKSKKLIYRISLTLFLFLMVVYKVIVNIDFSVWFSNYMLEFFVVPLGTMLLFSRSISYLTDVYRGDSIVEKNIVNLGVYLCGFMFFLPSPLPKYKEFYIQINNRELTIRRFSVGFCKIIFGLSKIVFLANNLGVISDIIFTYSAIGQGQIHLSSATTILGLICFTMQLYYMLSGGSDLAIGLALMFGFKLEENFDYPYMEKTLTGFWSKFLITLRLWINDYIVDIFSFKDYRGKDKEVVYMFFTYIFYFIWIGTKISFLLIGVLIAILIIFEFFMGEYFFKKHKHLQYLLFILVILATMVFWRTSDIYQSGQFFLNILGLKGNGIIDGFAWIVFKENLITLLIAFVFITPIAKKTNNFLFEKKDSMYEKISIIIYPITILALLISLIVCIPNTSEFLHMIFYY